MGATAMVSILTSMGLKWSSHLQNAQGKKHTVKIRYNGLEGTGEFRLLNPNVVKSNYQLLAFLF